ncbi:MAG TPA: TlpA disulfide reductase family protein [Chthonomonadales bacterium]|nr:TlpA disulfide reductase family protein [Chthonomonadales bacterium]
MSSSAILARTAAAARIVLLLEAIACRSNLAAAPQATSRLNTAARPTAKQFTLPDSHGATLRLPANDGRILVLNFWAFWCDTWKAEMPHLKELARRQNALRFQLVCVSVDGTRLEGFENAAGRSLPFPVLLDAGGNVTRAYNVQHVPTVIVIDPEDHIRFRWTGYPGNGPVLREIRKCISAEELHASATAGAVTKGTSARQPGSYRTASDRRRRVRAGATRKH